MNDQAGKDDDILMATVDNITILLFPSVDVPGKVLYFRVNSIDIKTVTISADKSDVIYGTSSSPTFTLGPTVTGVTLVSDGKGKWIVIDTM